jgi:hypothetical protein
MMLMGVGRFRRPTAVASRAPPQWRHALWRGCCRRIRLMGIGKLWLFRTIAPREPVAGLHMYLLPSLGAGTGSVAAPAPGKPLCYKPISTLRANFSYGRCDFPKNSYFDER